MAVYYFPDGSWDCQLEPYQDGYLAKWKDDNGEHIEPLLWEEVSHEDEEELLDPEFYSEDGGWYED